MTNILDTINDNLQDTLSLVILLENDLQQQHADEVYQRTIHVIHEQLKAAIKDIEIVILSILVDTFISKISFPMQPGPEIGSISDA